MIKLYGFFFVALLSFLKITTTSPTDAPAGDGAVSLREAIYLKQGLMEQKQRLESKDIARRSDFFRSDEWDYDSEGRARHKATGLVITKERRHVKLNPFMDWITPKKKRRKKKKKSKVRYQCCQ